MILTCPSCSARYKVDDKAFAGEAGRDVRCAKCHHMWHFEPKDNIPENKKVEDTSSRPNSKVSSGSFTENMADAEKSSLNDLINRIQSEEFDEIDFGDGKSNKKAKTPDKTNRPSVALALKTAIRNIKSRIRQMIEGPRAQIRSCWNKCSSVRRQVIGGLLGVMLFVALLVTILDNMEAIEEAFPPSIKVFQYAKLEWTDVPKIKLEDVLVVDHLTLEKEAAGEAGQEANFDIIKGTLINISQKEVQIPLLTLRMMDKNNLVVSEKNVSTGIESLAGEGQADFDIKLKAGELPEGAVKLEIFYGVSSKEKSSGDAANEPKDHKEATGGNEPSDHHLAGVDG